MLAALRSVFTSETISSSPRATSMALLNRPEPEQTSAALAILSPISSLARTSANEALTVVSRLVASMGCILSGTTHACWAREVERNVSNLMAHLSEDGSHSACLLGVPYGYHGRPSLPSGKLRRLKGQLGTTSRWQIEYSATSGSRGNWVNVASWPS